MKFTLSASILALLAAMPAVHAHMEMTEPKPIMHKTNPFASDNLKDYSYTSPISGPAQYPCKGVLAKAGPKELTPVATWAAGSQQSFSIGGGAVHGGGSCQASISEDGGKSFKVLRSYIGNCPKSSKYDFTVPKDTITGNVLFAWTWFNYEGNREMYMNCASVEITGGGSGLKKLPDIVVANSANPDCLFEENFDPEFENPGPNPVIASKKTVKGKGNCGPKAGGPGIVMPPTTGGNSTIVPPSGGNGGTTAPKPKPGNGGTTPIKPTPTKTTPSPTVVPNQPAASVPGKTQWYDPSTNPGIPKSNNQRRHARMFRA